MTVTLKDNFGNVITGYVGTVHFTSTDSHAVLPVDYTFTSADQGRHTFQVTFDTTGTQSVSVTDTANGASSMLLPCRFGHDLGSTACPHRPRTNRDRGRAAKCDCHLDRQLWQRGDSIRPFGFIHFVSTDGQAVLPADYTFTASDQGKHTFQVTFKTAGSQSLSITDTANNALKATTNVNVTTASQLLVITGLGQTATAGAAQSITVAVTDSFGNAITGYTGTVHFTSTDGQAVLPVDYTFTSADQGQHAFQVTFKTAGSQSVSVTDTVNSRLKSDLQRLDHDFGSIGSSDRVGTDGRCRHAAECDCHVEGQLRQRHHWLCRHRPLHQHRRPSQAAPPTIPSRAADKGQICLSGGHLRYHRHTVGQRHGHGEQPPSRRLRAPRSRLRLNSLPSPASDKPRPQARPKA